jgi:hypothetical protein
MAIAVAFLALVLSGCGPASIFDEEAEQKYQAAARQQWAACYAVGASFFVPPEQCDDGAAIWNAAVDAFGAPQHGWAVFGRSRDWMEAVHTDNGLVVAPVAGVAYLDTARIVVNIGTRGWCSGALLHEFWHARALQSGHENWPTEELEAVRRQVCFREAQ